MQIDEVHCVTDGMDVFALEGTGLSYKVVIPDQGDKENIQIGLNEQGRFLRLCTQFLFDLQQRALQEAGLCGGNAVSEAFTMGKAKVDAAAAKAIKRGAKQIAWFKLQSQKIDRCGGNFCDIMKFVTGKDKYIAFCNGISFTAYTVSACAGQDVGNLKLGMSVLGDRADVKRCCDIIHFQQDISITGTDLTDLLFHFVLLSNS